MGIHGLWQLLNPVARPIALETLSNKRLAIDASIWLYQFQMAMRDKKTGDPLQGAHIMGTFRRIVKLLYHGIKPVFVFDGDAPMLKKRTIAERKKRKAGATKDLAKTAQQLLSAQLRAAAAEHQLQKKKRRLSAIAATNADSDTGDIIDPSTVVYFEDLDKERPTSAVAGSPSKKPTPPKKSALKDAYALPVLEGSLQSRALPTDSRLATETELRDFIEDLKPEDFDLSSPFFAGLPTEIKYEIIGDLRIKSRQVNHKRVEAMRKSHTPLDFSKAQITNLMERNSLTQKLFEVTDTLGQSSIRIPTRVAGVKNKEYVLVKQDDDKGGGWVLGVRDPKFGQKEVVVIDDTDEDESEDQEEETDEDEFEEVGIAPANQRTPSPDRETRRILAIEAIRARYAPNDKTDFDPFLDGHLPSRKESAAKATLFANGFGDEEEEEEDEQLQRALLESAKNAANVASQSPEQEEPSYAAMDFDFDPAYQEGSDDELEYVPNEGYGGPLPNMELPPLPLPAPPPAPPPITTSTVSKEVIVIQSDSDEDSDEFEEVQVDSQIVSPPQEPQQSQPLKSASPLPSLESQKSPSPPASPPTVAEPVVPRHPSQGRVLSLMESFLPSDDSDSDVEVSTSRPTIISRQLQAKKLRPPEIETSPSPPRPPVIKHQALPPPHPSAPMPSTSTSNSSKITHPIVSSSSTGIASTSILPISPPTPQSHPTEPSLSILPEVPKGIEEQIMKELEAYYSLDTVAAPEATNSAVDLEEMKPADSTLENEEKVFSGRETEEASSSAANELEMEVSNDDEDEVEVEVEVEVKKDKGKGKAEAEESEEEEEEEDEEFFEGWERSPTPPPRNASAAVYDSADDHLYTSEPDLSEEDQMDLEQETSGYADMVSRLNNKDLVEMRDQAQTEMAKLSNQKNTDQRNADGVTRQMAGDIKELLQLFGIPYVDAPQEAEAECAALLTKHLIDGIVTDDSDVFLFGGSRIYRHMFNDNKYVECYLLDDLDRELGLDRDKLVKLSYLLGGDYAEGLPGVGPVVGRELLEEFRGGDGLKDFKAWWGKVQNGKDGEDDTDTPWKRKFKRGHKNLFIEDNWPNPLIAKAYYNPVVNEDDEPFSWAGPDLDGLRSYLNNALSWSTTKTDEVMLPLIRRQNERKAGKLKVQGNLGDYFDISAGNGPLPPRQQRAGYASERLQNVVQNWRKSQRKSEEKAASGSEDFEDVEQRPPPPKRKKKVAPAKSASPTKDPTPEAAAPAPTAKRVVAPNAVPKKATSKKPRKKPTEGPPKTTAASRKRMAKERKEARAAARGGELSSDEDLGPTSARFAEEPRARRKAALKRPIVDEGSESDAAGSSAKRKKVVESEEEDDG